MHNLEKLYHQIRRYFIFHPQDKYGIIVLLTICGILVLAPEVYYHFFRVEKDFTALHQQKMEAFIAWSKQNDTINAVLAKNKYNNPYHNDYNAEFYDYEATERNSATMVSNNVYKKSEPTKPIDINTATAADFKLLKGIGEVFSERIVKFRNTKKGFNNIEELKKVYGISDSLFATLLPKLTISKKPGIKKRPDEPNYTSKAAKAINEPPITKDQLFEKVDINTATAEELKTLKGIGNILSERIVKYRDSKGGFDAMEELNDVYGIEDSLYLALSDRIEMSTIEKPVETEKSFKTQDDNSASYTSINDEITLAAISNEPENDELFKTKKLETPKPKANLLLNININTANVEELMQLRGIGEFRAKAIVEHRSKLGGFYQLQQVMEAYSIDDSLYQSILPSLTLGAPNIRKININKVEFKALLKHPYIDYNLTKHLINFRDQRKKGLKRKGLKSIEELKESFLIDEELYQKLSVYLTVE